MKTRYIFSGVLLLPLIIVIILAITGITLNVWVYVVLAVVCPLAAGVVWFLYYGFSIRTWKEECRTPERSVRKAVGFVEFRKQFNQ